MRKNDDVDQNYSVAFVKPLHNCINNHTPIGPFQTQTVTMTCLINYAVQPGI